MRVSNRSSSVRVTNKCMGRQAGAVRGYLSHSRRHQRSLVGRYPPHTRTARDDSPGVQIASPPTQLPDNLIYCAILALARIRFRLLLRPAVAVAVVYKVWRHLMFGQTVRRLGEGSPGRQMASLPVQLPDDLIYLGILARLPLRSLLRFTVVCKAWRHLILGDPAFARTQAGCPSPASAVLARYHQGRLKILTPGASVAAAVAPRDASLSFLPVAGWKLRLCSATSGVLCMIVNPTDGGTTTATFYVVNPATRAFRVVPYAGEDGIKACLAYDPSMVHHKGYSIIVPVQKKMGMIMFWSFSSSRGCGWRMSGAEVRLTAPYDFVRPKPLYLDGRAHWLCNRGGVLWHDAWTDTAGTQPPPPFLLLPGGGEGQCLEGNKELVGWHGRIGMVFAGKSCGLVVWALSSTSSPARWEMVHLRQWDEIPGVARLPSSFLWSVVPAGMEYCGEGALVLAVRIAHGPVGPRRPTQQQQQHGGYGAGGEEEDVWRREFVRYDMRTGGTAVAGELVVVGKQIHDVAPPASDFVWSVVPAGMEGGGEKALGLAVRIAHGPRRHAQQHGVGGEEEDVWRRELVRYDVRTGTTAVLTELVGKEIHDDFGAVFCYHSSMAPLS
ncbi:unnamed protein product [Alopecurus aequalis]